MSNEPKWQQLYEREKTSKRICSELNHFVDLKPTLSTILKYMKDISRCEALSIRLLDDGDYPYFVYDGFEASFIQKENSLCKKDEHGDRVASPDGEGFVLECMCGNIIHERFDPALPFFTEHGSFWSNHTTHLLASTSAEDRQADTRNHCNSCGYESVALIPIKTRDATIGLIQCNDLRQDRFTLDVIEYLEMIGGQIGLAVASSMIHEKLKKSLEETKILRGLFPICVQCKKIRDDDGYWHQIEAYIRDHSEADFSHGYCTECYGKMMSEVVGRPRS